MTWSSACSKDDVPKQKEKSKEAYITVWRTGGVVVKVTGDVIKVILPFDTKAKINSLTANVTMSANATISPNPINPRDYTNPVEFTVTAEDGETQNRYTVIVEVAKNNKATISKFNIGEHIGVVGGNVITIELPFGTKVDPLRGSFDIDLPKGATVEPKLDRFGSSTLYFLGGLAKFTVIAEDRVTRKEYTVKVKLPFKSALPEEYYGTWATKYAMFKIVIESNKFELYLNGTKGQIPLSRNILDKAPYDDFYYAYFGVNWEGRDRKISLKYLPSGRLHIKAWGFDGKSGTHYLIKK